MVVCIPLYLWFLLSMFISMLRLRFAPGVCFDVLSAPIGCGWSCCRLLIETSSSDHCCKSCMISVARGGFVRFFRSKHACFAFSQLRLVSELVVANSDRGVFGFLPMCASKGETLKLCLHHVVLCAMFFLFQQRPILICIVYSLDLVS